MNISVDYDDLSCLSHRFDLCEKLRERYPDFRVTFFTIPWDIRFSPATQGTPITDEKYKDWCTYVKKAVADGWMQIGIHGLTHAPREFEQLTYDETKKRVLIAQKMFENVGIPITNLFKAPYWLLSKDGKKAIEDLGLKVVEDGYYNWNLKYEPWFSGGRLWKSVDRFDPVMAHGHIADGMGCDNGMDESFLRLCTVPQDAKWIFLSEVL